MPLFRRLRGKLDQATRDGDTGLYILTHLPLRKASAKRVAQFDRKRWTLETACQHLKAYFQSAIHTLGYPKAAWFGFCLAWVADNRLAVVLAARRSVHGAETIDQDLSLDSVANDIAHTYHGMMMAICLHRETAQGVTSQCGDILIGLVGGPGWRWGARDYYPARGRWEYHHLEAAIGPRRCHTPPFVKMLCTELHCGEVVEG